MIMVAMYMVGVVFTAAFCMLLGYIDWDSGKSITFKYITAMVFVSVFSWIGLVSLLLTAVIAVFWENSHKIVIHGRRKEEKGRN